ncbi:MAG: hypothetical protein ACQSGP_03075 [Frankia sp.]
MQRRDFVGLAGLALLGNVGMSAAKDRLALNVAALDRLLDTSARRPPLDVMHTATGIAGELEELLRERLSPSQVLRVGSALANVNVVRADTAHKLDRPADARALARRARLQARMAGHQEQQGLAMRVSAIIEYHEGNAERALRFARAGREQVSWGPVGAALAAEEARARALAPGRHSGPVEDAIAEALRLANGLPAADLAVARFGLTYNPLEAHYVGALSHLRGGDPAAAQDHLAEARPTFDALGLRHFSAGLRVEEAHALLRPGAVDVEQACALAREAMGIYDTWRSRRLSHRLGAFARRIGPLRASPVAREAHTQIVEWLAAPGTATG